MSKLPLPRYVFLLLFFGVIVCSLLSGIFIIPAIAFFSILCIVGGLPFLVITMLVSGVASAVLNFGQGDFMFLIYAIADSLSYVLPSVLIAIAYFREYSKFQTIINGAVGLFIYNVGLAITHFLMKYGTFGREILNTVIDTYISEFVDAFSQTTSTFQASGQTISLETAEQLLYSSKPLIPACVAVMFFLASYIAVCLSNLILKKLTVIENMTYRLVPHVAFGAVFVAALVGSIFSDSDSFAYILFGSLIIFLAPMFFISGTGVVFDALSKAFKNKIAPAVLIAVILMCAGTIIYNLFYLIGCYYSIICGIRNIESEIKGGKK